MAKGRDSAKISKTAKASLRTKAKRTHLKACPKCNEPMTALKVMKFLDYKGGMFWVCDKDNIRIPIH